MLKTVSNTGVTTGSVVYQGVWNASTNTPTLVSSVGTQGNYYVVSVAGSTNLNGVTLWGVGDWAIFNGLVWQKVDAGDTTNVTSITVTGLTGYMYANNTSPVTASTTIPNLGLANSTTTLGNATLTLGGTTTNVGNLTLANVTITSVGTTFPNSYLSNNTATLGNATITLGSTTSTVGNLSLTNVTISNVASTFPNSFLANSTATLGNATITLGGTTTSVGNLTLTNATITSGNVTITGGSINVQSTNLVSTTSVTATYGTASLPLQPLGFIQVDLNGTVVKVPYYAV